MKGFESILDPFIFINNYFMKELLEINYLLIDMKSA